MKIWGGVSAGGGDGGGGQTASASSFLCTEDIETEGFGVGLGICKVSFPTSIVEAL